MKRSYDITIVQCKGCGVDIDVLTGFNGLCYKCAMRAKYDKQE